MSYQSVVVPVEGGELFAGIWGSQDSETVILAPHGITANHTCWQPLADLMPEAMIIAPDLRGRGRSKTVSEPFGLLQHARDLESLLDYLGVEKAIVVGHSMGGFVSVRFAANFPDRVSSLVLVDGGLPLKRPANVETADLVSATLGPAAERLAMVFDERSAYQEFWKEHPAFRNDFNKYVSAYVDYDLTETPTGLQPSGQIKAVEADIRELFGEDEYLQEMRLISVPTVFIRAPRGLLDDQALYDAELDGHHSELITNLRVVNSQDFNHYTIVLSIAGSEVVAEEINRLVSLSESKQEAR